MTVTFATLKSRVAKRIIDPSSTAISAADVGQAINDATAFYKQRPYWFNQKHTQITMDTNDPFILGFGNANANYPLAPSLPSDFLYEDPRNGFVIQYSQLSYTMVKVNPQEYDSANVQGVGIPSIYTWRNGNYEFYLYPQQAFLMDVYYYGDYADMVNDTDNNDFTNFADKMIEYDAIGRLLADIRLDDERADRFFKRAAQEEANIKKRSAKMKATGRLDVETIL